MNRLEWKPEDLFFWQEQGRAIAYRNLLFSSVSLLLAFVVWIQWSATIAYFSKTRPELSINIIYFLTASPLLSAAFLRIPYSFVVPQLGGARWTTLSTLVLVLPSTLTFACFEYQLSTPWCIVAALLTGLAGANFASHSHNISHFFPYRLKGLALGLHSAVGNLGVGVGQWLLPLLVLGAAGTGLPLQIFDLGEQDVMLGVSPLFLSGLCILMAIACWLGMNDLQMNPPRFSEQFSVLCDRQCWNVCLLYTFAFGTFLGLSSICPYLIAKYFGLAQANSYAFAGATLGALTRPLGHVLSYTFGAVKTTLYCFACLFAASSVLWVSLHFASDNWGFSLFFSSYLVLFCLAGLTMGSTTALIPEIYQAMHVLQKKSHKQDSSAITPSEETATVVAFSSAVATFGAFLIPLSFDASRILTGTEAWAIFSIGIGYVGCWWYTYRSYAAFKPRNPLYWQSPEGHQLIVDCPRKMNRLEQDLAA